MVEIFEDCLVYIKILMSLLIIGCVVNGLGEVLMIDVGFIGGGVGLGMVYLVGKVSYKMLNDQMIDYIVEEVEKKVVELDVVVVE